MSVDFESIASRCRCEVSSLKLAAPLLEQGLSPPFLARYRRDELSGIDEGSLWTLSTALETERQVADRRNQLQQVWESTALKDPAIEAAIRKSASQRMLGRVARRLKSEADAPSDASRLAARVLSPQKGDPEDLAELAALVPELGDPATAVAELDAALASRLRGDPRVISSAVRWLTKQAKIKVERISDPHTAPEEPEKAAKTGKAAASGDEAAASNSASADGSKDVAPPAKPGEPASAGESIEQASAAGAGKAASSESAPAQDSPATSEPAAADSQTPVAAPETAPVAPATPPAESETVPAASETTGGPEAQADPSVDGSAQPATEDAVSVTAEPVAADAPPTPETPASETPDAGTAASETPAAVSKGLPAGSSAAASTPKKSGKKAEPAAPKKPKKVSPRQRRRRWLVSVLKSLSGKQFDASKLSSFQIVMLARALRSQVAECSFRYDATKLVAELQHCAGGLNRVHADRLREIVLKNEGVIRESAESAWWDDLQERASARLVDVTANQLRRQMNRGGVQANVVLAIDAVGPKTAAASVVTADGRMLQSEDIACGLGKAQRALAVAKIGELIHAQHVDLIVISNGPARRAMMVALAELVAQSPAGSIRWTLAERSGADAYAGSDTASSEMRATPRRFRAAAWLAFSVLHPAQALAKIDPLKLRLNAFQKELSEPALASAMEGIMVSGASRGGVDVNGTPAAWLSRLPGMNAQRAKAIDSARRSALFPSRQALLESGLFDEAASSRQTLPFLRVFGSDQALDGTLVHPDDYPLAERLAKALEIELPPDCPPGYVAPDYSQPSRGDAVADLKPAEPAQTPAKVEEFSEVAGAASDFKVDDQSASSQSASSETTETTDAATPPNEESPGESVETPAQEASAAEAADPTPAESEPAQAATDAGAGESSTEDPAAEGPATEVAPAEDNATEDAPAQDTATEVAASEDTPAEVAPAEVHSVRRPVPEKASIDKCVKEWQIGANRAHQIVHWLCDPFGDSDPSESASAVMSAMPTLADLKPGDQVIGIVVGIMPFGVFVELAPDCSGLVHISKLSDTFVDDLHEAVGVGDIVTAYVTGIDEKRRRVGLSLLSPQREAELEAQRSERRKSGGYGNRGGGPRGRSGGGNRGDARGQQRGGGQNRGGGGDSRGRGASGGGRPSGKSGDRPRGRGPARSGDSRGGGRRGPRKPESYRVESKKEAKPLTEEMKEGKEPLRSFGDLAQFLTKEKPPAPKSKPEPEASSQPAPEASQAVAGDQSAQQADAGPSSGGAESAASDSADSSPAENVSPRPTGGDAATGSEANE